MDLIPKRKARNIWHLLVLCLFFLTGCEKDVSEAILYCAEEDCIENQIVKNYINSVVYDDNDYSYSYILNYCSITTDWDKSCPSPIIITISNNIVQDLNQKGIDSLLIQTYYESFLIREDVCKTAPKISIYNLIPQREYSFLVSYRGESGNYNKIGEGPIFVKGRFRALYVDGIHNIRDIGGYQTIYGRRVKYDKLFRSAELQRKANPAQGNITQKGINEIVNNLKIDVELDFGDEYEESPIQGWIDFVSSPDYLIHSYDLAMNLESIYYTGDQIKNCFNLILSKLKENRKVIFHCNAGADRTGTLAFILESLLGVCESDLAKDFEITSFFNGYTRRRDVDWVEDRGSGYSAMIAFVKTHFEGSNINEKVENMMMSFGVSLDSIEEFRQLMLDDFDDISSKKKL